MTTLNFFSLGTTEQYTDVIAGFAFIQELAEHFDTGTCGLLSRFDTYDFDIITYVQYTTLYTTGYYRTTARD